MLARFFVDRPVFATVLSIIIVMLGGIASLQLPVAQYPEVTPPTIQITATYPGPMHRWSQIQLRRRLNKKSMVSKA